MCANPESETITSFYLVPEDGESLPQFLPGQFLTIALSMLIMGVNPTPALNSTTGRSLSISR